MCLCTFFARVSGSVSSGLEAAWLVGDSRGLSWEHVAAHRSRGAAHRIMAKHFVLFEVQQQQCQWYYQQLKRRRENDRECSSFGRSAAELFEMVRGDCSTRSSRSTSFSDARVVDQPVAKADDELSETEIETDDGEGTLASPNDAQLTAESCSAWASVRDQSILRSSTESRHSGGRSGGEPSRRLRRRGDWLNLGSAPRKLSSFGVEKVLPSQSSSSPVSGARNEHKAARGCLISIAKVHRVSSSSIGICNNIELTVLGGIGKIRQ